MEGNIHLYCPSYLDEHLVVGLVQGLRQQDSHLKLVSYPWPADSFPDLNSSKFGIGINRFPFNIDSNYVQRRLGSVTMGVYLNRASSLAALESIDVVKLKGCKFAALNTGANVDVQDEARCREMGIDIHVDISLSSMRAALRCVEELDYMVVSADIFNRGNAMNLTWRPLTLDGQPVEYEYGFVYHRAWYQHPAMKSMESIIRRCYRDITRQYSCAGA
nr:substrate-binding domain-containing protein [Shewanella abyssi]